MSNPQVEVPGAGPKGFGRVPMIVRRVVLLAVLAAVAALLWAAWPAVPKAWEQNFAGRPLVAFATDGRAVLLVVLLILETMFAAVLAVVLGQAIILAQAEPITPHEQDVANWIIFVFVSLGTIISEIIGAVLSWPLLWITIFLLILASLMLIYATAFWLWTGAYIAARRQLCQVWIPWVEARFYYHLQRYSECVLWSYDSFIACAAWGFRHFERCDKYANKTHRECAQFNQQIANVCPWYLTPFCVIGEIFVALGCAVWVLVTEFVCVVFVLITELVCLVFILVMIITCLIYLVFWLIVDIVMLLFVYLMRIFYFC